MDGNSYRFFLLGRSLPLLIFLASFPSFVKTQTVQSFTVGNKIQIRALEVVNDSVVWFGANRGIFGYTLNGGKSWKLDSIKADNLDPQFRSISVLNDSTALLLSIDSPAYLMKTANRGRSWKMVHKDIRKGVFFDCMVFTDKKNGYALGDPIDNCFQLISTNDGGETWKQFPCSSFPKAEEGEACFAASNSNLIVRGRNIWFVTGGKQSRIFYSSDHGKHFRSSSSPLPQGETMTGIFAFDFFDEKKGVIAGGHYEKTDSSIVALAITNDAGDTWTALRTSRLFFGSCVRFLSKEKVIVTGHNGTFVVDLKSGSAEEILNEKGEELKFYTLRLTPDRKVSWLAGSGGRITKIRNK
jgi:photosystem II stability/assembly factor-like uncharacterized protein